MWLLKKQKWWYNFVEILDVHGQELNACKEIVKMDFRGMFGFLNIGGWVEKNWKNLVGGELQVTPNWGEKNKLITSF